MNSKSQIVVKNELIENVFLGHNHVSLPVRNVPTIPICQTNIPEQPTISLTDAFTSNLTALMQSNHPVNPFSPYGYSMAAQAQSSSTHHPQSTVFTPKRGTNPFDDDLIRR